MKIKLEARHWIWALPDDGEGCAARTSSLRISGKRLWHGAMAALNKIIAIMNSPTASDRDKLTAAFAAESPHLLARVRVRRRAADYRFFPSRGHYDGTSGQIRRLLPGLD
jgi:hypothetical protein